MNPHPRFATLALTLTAMATSLVLTTEAWAQDSAQRCRSLTDATARLACYDALPLRPDDGSTTTPSSKAGSVPATDPQRDFGKPVQPTTATSFVDSQVAGTFDGWEPNQLIELVNGQTWRIVDGSRAYVAPRSKPMVRVEQGAFGAFYLSVEGLAQAPRVRRVK